MGIAEFQNNITILFINIPDYYRIDLTVPVIVQNLPAQFCRTFFNVLTFCDLIFVLTAFKFVDNVFDGTIAVDQQKLSGRECCTIDLITAMICKNTINRNISAGKMLRAIIHSSA